jgi:hypothetical protein
VLELREVQPLLETPRTYPGADVDSVAELGDIELGLARSAAAWGLALHLLRGTLDSLQLEPMLSHAFAARAAA